MTLIRIVKSGLSFILEKYSFVTPRHCKPMSIVILLADLFILHRYVAMGQGQTALLRLHFDNLIELIFLSVVASFRKKP